MALGRVGRRMPLGRCVVPDRRERLRVPRATGRQQDADDGALAPVVQPGGLTTRIVDASHGGAPLDRTVQQHLESTLGADLAGMRIHTGGEADTLARAVDAIAFTSGRNIF